MNIPMKGDISMDVCAHVGAETLKGLAPVIESSDEEVEALEE